METRDDLLGRVRVGDVPDILVIGGGINGVGTFRDLAAQGVPALLVEAGDFSSGTSAAPTRLIHGGLRYLETGEAALVRESLTERNLLLQNACHVVRPQPVWVPLQSWLGGSVAAVARFLRLRRTPGPKGAVPVKLGLMIYDRFGRAHQTMPDHRVLTAAQARKEVSILAKDTRAVAEYYDARITHPERLVLELIADAEADCPEAFAIPYLAAGRQEGGSIALTDTHTGETFAVTPRTVINAGGAWVDQVQSGLGFEGRLMGGTRGSHLMVHNPDLCAHLGGRMLYFETEDHRACFILPMDESHLYLGSTDIRTDDPGDRHCTDEEIAYILDVCQPIVPDIPLRREDIVFAMAGVRPLPYQEVAATGAISRDHRLDIHAATEARPFETFTLVGGKWTTYRAFAEQVADAVLQSRGAVRSLSTASLPIGGADDLPAEARARAEWSRQLADDTGLTPDRCAVLVSRYGSGARAVAEAERASNARFTHLDGYTPAEIDRLCRLERVTRLQDVVLRRTLMGFEGVATAEAIAEVGAVAATALGWDAARQAAEIEDTRTLMRTRHRVAAA